MIPDESSSSPSASSRTESRTESLDEQDESVRIAVRALGDMKKGTRNSTPSSATAQMSPSISPPPDAATPDFVSRVTSIPLVGTALRAYEHGKASSRVVKYGAEMMESSVKNISRPVIDRLPVDVNQLDEFACRQLDRLERYRRSSTADEKMQSPISPASETAESISTAKSPRDYDLLEAGNTSHSTESRTPTPQSQDRTGTSDQNANQQVVPRSRWQTVLLEAGGIGAAVSEESMRRLKYCLQWLLYATAHIDSQMLILRDFIDSLQSYVVDPSTSDAYISPTHMRTLTDVRRNVVNTVRQVVDVVSKYAGGALPEPARARVRGFILHLPQRWATAANTGATGIPEGSPGASSAAGASAGSGLRVRTTRHHKQRSAGGPDRSLSGTPASSRASSPLASSRASMGRPTASGATRAAQHILTLATESLDMMRGVTSVVKDSLDRADTWVERLRIIGVQRQQQQTPDETFDLTVSPFGQHRQSLPGLSSTPSTPMQSDTPLSIPSTPLAYPSPDGFGIRLSEMAARTSLSELRLDGDGREADGYETPKYGVKSLHEGDEQIKGRIWRRRSAADEDERDTLQDMVVDDVNG